VNAFGKKIPDTTTTSPGHFEGSAILTRGRIECCEHGKYLEYSDSEEGKKMSPYPTVLVKLPFTCTVMERGMCPTGTSSESSCTLTSYRAQSRSMIS
jgi:hypothetical protein